MAEEAQADAGKDAQQPEAVAASRPQVRIAWSKEDQAFRVVDDIHDRTAPNAPSKRGRNSRDADSIDSLETAVKAFGVLREEVPTDHDLEEQLETRRGILDQILNRRSALVLLPDFLSRWRRALSHIVSQDAMPQATQGVVTDVCTELQQLAETEMLVGDIAQARASLGQCIRLARHHQLDTTDSIVSEAKRVLIDCIHFQEQLKLCAASLKRQNAPFSIQHKILGMLKQLQLLAPLAVEVMALHTGVLMSMGRSREVVSSLSAFAFTETDAQLTLLYVRALEYEGFYNDSISTAMAFCGKYPTAEDEQLLKALDAHVLTLKSVLLSKTAAEDALLQSRFDQAEEKFSEAMQKTQTKSRKLRASLLLGRANARIALERMRSARRDLEESLELDASNQLTRLRLQTVQLALESQHIRRRLDKVTLLGQ